MIGKRRTIGILLVMLIGAGLLFTGCSKNDDSGGSSVACGDGVVEGDEVCDGSNIGNRTCQDEGFVDGILSCNTECTGYDTTGCDGQSDTDKDTAVCGNGVIDGQEVCDGLDLGGENCETQGYAGGTLACSETCDGFDTGSCRSVQCGDGIIDGGEVCDGSNIGNRTCQDEGFAGGVLSCSPDCTIYDTSECISCVNRYIVDTSMSVVGSSTFPGIGGGDCLLVQAGNRGWLRIRDIRGEPGNPIVIINHGGRVSVDAQQNWVGIWLTNCEHVRLTGTGDSHIVYGFEIFNSSGIGFNATQKTRFFEVDHIEVHNVGGAGISTKTDEAIRDTWTQYDTYLHHNYLHDIGTEGTYIGSSKWEEGLYPELDGVEIAFNRVERTGWDGIQVASAPRNVSVHHNIVIDSGLGDEPSGGNTGFGFCIGKGTAGQWYNNYSANSRREGIYLNGGPVGEYRIYNNIFLNSGRDGILWQTGRAGEIFENTIVKSVRSGIGTGAHVTGEIFDNLVLEYGDKGVASQSLNVSLFNNLEFQSPEAAHMADYVNNDFHLTEASPAKDAGTLSRNAAKDYDGVSRPQGGAPDIGAYEYVASPSLD